MNKKFFTQILSLVALALIGWGCETDHFNEHMIDGYEPENTITDVQNINRTLSESDYAAISSNSANKAIAEAAGEDAVAALAAIGKNKYFASSDEAATYIPGLLADEKNGYPSLDNGSVVMATYTHALDLPEELQKMNAAHSYTLSDADYMSIWGSETDFVKAVTPATISKLKSAITVEDIRQGEYVAVTYNYSAEEPSSDEPETPADPEPETGYTSVLGAAKLNDAVEVRGYISAVSTQGPILTDKGGSVLLYKTNGYEIGDEVTVKGTISAYNKGFQIGTDGISVEKTGTTTVTYPQPIELDGPAMDELLETRTEDGYAQFVKFTGTAAASKYINIEMEGAETAQGSVYGASDEVKALFTDGEECTIYGYFCSISSGKFINVIVVSVDEAPAIDAGNSYTSVLGSAKLDEQVEVKGYISALSTQGPMLTDNTGSILLYKTSGYELGDEVTVKGTIGAYNCGFQIGTSGISIEKTGTTTVTYPAPMDLTGAKMDELLESRTEDEYAYYAKMTGKLSISGNYYNFNVDGANTAVGSLYGVTEAIKEQLSDGMNCTLYGYFVSISKSGGAPKYINMVVTSVAPVTKGTATRALGSVESVKMHAYYKWNGSSFEDTDIVAVQPADFTEMGNSYGSFTHPSQDDYLPKFLARKLPYAMTDDVVNVAYRCYSSGSTSWKVDEYVNKGTEWVKTIYFADKTDQFRKNDEGVWAVDRTLELDFTNTASAETKAFYQYCCNWVYDNKDVALGAPARDNAGVIVSADIVTIDGAKPTGSFWVSNYGNNEFYTGASAYYGNMDWRPSACKGGFAAAGMGDLSDEEILAKLKEHTAEVFAEVLHYVYPEMTPAQYKKVVIKVYAYGPNADYSFTFDVVDTGKFAYVVDSITEL